MDVIFGVVERDRAQRRYAAAIRNRISEHLAVMVVPADVPFYHWSDIDPDGTWIFRTIERVVGRSLIPHLMSIDPLCSQTAI
jgi:hypothetical protein